MTRRDWWIGITAIVLALLLHAVVPQYLPRYEWRNVGRGVLWAKIDRWTGSVETVRVTPGQRTAADNTGDEPAGVR